MATFTYSGDPSQSDLDAVRFHVGDTDSAEPFLSDAEITYLVGQYPDKDPLFVASKAAEAIASRMTREIGVSADGESVATDQLATRFMDLAKELLAQWREKLRASGLTVYGGGMRKGENPVGVLPFEFGLGLHDNDRAGEQSFGGDGTGPYYDPTRETWR